jgi:hypothetical protein
LSKPREGWQTSSFYAPTEDLQLLQGLMEQRGMSRSAVLRSLIRKAALGDGPDDVQHQIRQHVAELSKLVL